ncbi:MAG TPA: phosphate ABC transporter permease [Pseudohongiella sp.]|nr:phosphate ABC transporter permease [Pseudohongiella sp.]HBX38431.1 phosphate ABC transporter permease [Pseudohongiella sp.]|tara:strand:+ start:6957 stop:9254 length:2298 start_codon:yes stop_codon:yes gene_type:complete
MSDLAPDIPTPDKPRVSLLPGAEQRQRMRQRRARRDSFSKWGITAAGYGVVLALATIFIYLFYEVAPIFRGATVDAGASYQPAVSEGETRQLLLERYQTMGVQYTDDAEVVFFDSGTGATLQRFAVPLPDGVQPTSFYAAEPISNMHVYGLSNGQAQVVQHQFDISFPVDERVLTPRLAYPLGQQPITVDTEGQPLDLVAVETNTRGVTASALAAYTRDGRMLLTSVSSRNNLLTGQVQISSVSYELPDLPATPQQLLLDKSLRNLFVIDTTGNVHYYDISTPTAARLVQTVDAGGGERITAAAFLVGTVSLVLGTESGELSQWFLVRDEQNNFRLEEVRRFDSHGAEITAIAPEHTRKGFIAVDRAGQIGIHYGTSSRTLLLDEFSDVALTHVAVSQINQRILYMDEQGTVTEAELWNEHPQLSWAAMWNRVWYEGRADPEFIWQSSSGSDEFESKFSLVPLSLGTLKAAFYAMLFAMPLGIAGAIYTAYFMTPKLRGVVKPSIEIMEALPTVILGFLAGLWLAPFVESNLPAVFSILFLMPVMLLVFAYAWSRLPVNIRSLVPEGWEAALLVPVILIFGYLCLAASPWVEVWMFGGSMRQWFTNIGINYDQRNALIVGIAMGFAVIPTIFSIAEDAVFTVPKHLTQGSLALGATRWQTVVGVVLPTASPGIFSAVMMGFGRAVGETMIVLMATGNSPVVNFNIFEGMRTLSANIAVELPETAVGSSHFRVLFLAALVLLALTFVVNTLAEIIRQRLRHRYSNL